MGINNVIYIIVYNNVHIVCIVLFNKISNSCMDGGIYNTLLSYPNIIINVTMMLLCMHIQCAWVQSVHINLCDTIHL